ncbi:MAG: hypothetical protein WC900_10675, partial [Oscillospiraceae bacterium]|jgi:uncharacterized integral membrane protein
MKKADDRFRKLSEELSQLERKSGKSFPQDRNVSASTFFSAMFSLGAGFFSVGLYFAFKRLEVFSLSGTERFLQGGLFSFFAAFSFFSGNIMLFFMKRKRYGAIILSLAAIMTAVFVILTDSTHLDFFAFKPDALIAISAAAAGAAIMLAAVILRRKKRNAQKDSQPLYD